MHHRKEEIKISIFREWYSYHFPELVKIVNDNSMYVKVTKVIKNRKGTRLPS